MAEVQSDRPGDQHKIVEGQRGGRPSKGSRVSFMLRLPEELVQELDQWASEERRDMPGGITLSRNDLITRELVALVRAKKKVRPMLDQSTTS